MSLTTVFDNDRQAKVHFSEYFITSFDDDTPTLPGPLQPEQPEAE